MIAATTYMYIGYLGLHGRGYHSLGRASEQDPHLILPMARRQRQRKFCVKFHSSARNSVVCGKLRAVLVMSSLHVLYYILPTLLNRPPFEPLTWELSLF